MSTNSHPISYEAFRKKRPRWTKSMRRHLEYGLLKAFISLARILSFDRLQQIGRGLGHLAFYVLKKDRGIIEEQLAMVFPQSTAMERRQQAHECFLHFGQMLLEFVGMDKADREFAERVTVYGAEHLEAGFARGKGVILLAPHFGNWELFMPYFRQHQYPACAITKPLYDERFEHFILERREQGAKILSNNSPSTALTALKALRRNETLFVLVDQDTNVSSMFVPFFGVPASTPTTVSNFALRTNAAVISGYVLRKPNGRFEMHYEPVGAFDAPKPTPEDIYQTTLQFNKQMEHIITQDPTQWAWFHRRWKRQPSEDDLAFIQKMEGDVSHE